MSKRMKRYIWRSTVSIVLLGVVISGAWSLRSTGGEEPAEEPAEQVTTKDRFHTVKRGNFSVTIPLEASFDAIRRHHIRCPHVNRGLEVIEVCEDRSEVKKGDVLIRFSEARYKEELDNNLLELEDQKKNLELEEASLEMTQVALVNDVKSATDELKTAMENKRKYVEQEAPQKLKEFRAGVEKSDSKVKLALAKVSAAEDKLTQTRTNDTEKIADLDEAIDKAKDELEVATNELEKARYALRVFKQYDYPQMMRSLNQKLSQARMKVQRSLVNAEAKTEQSKQRIQNYKLKIKKKQDHIGYLKWALDSLTLRAPVDGIVTLGNPWSWRSTEIAVGSTQHRGRVVATIPDLSSFVVQTKLPEEYRSQVKIGDRVSLSSKALPNLKMHGTIKFIAPMARNVIRWDKNSPKIYPVEIATDAKDPRMMPGMTVQAEIIVEEVQDVIFIPIECARQREGRLYCKVKTLAGIQEREIQKGKSSERYAEITDGLVEGDQVLLSKDSANQ